MKKLVTLVLVIGFMVACSGMTPRQKFYYTQVTFSGLESAAVAYLRTPYGQQADDSVLTAIDEGVEEGTATLKRIRPLIPAAGEEVSGLHLELIEVGLETMDSIIERLNRTVFAPEMYEETQ